MKLSAKIGVIQLRGDRVRVCVVSTGGAAPTILDSVEVPVGAAVVEGTDPTADAVRDAVRSLSPSPHSYVLCAGSFDSVVRVLPIPVRGARRVAAAVQFELEPYLAFPIEELVVDHLPIREVDGQTEVLAVGMRRAAIEPALAALQAAGVDPEGIGLDALGLTALWLCRHRQAKGLNALVHFHQDGATLVVLADRRVAFMRPMAGVTCQTLGESPVLVAREISNSLRAYLASSRATEPVAGIHLTGCAPDAALEGALAEAFGAPVLWVELREVVRVQTKLRKKQRRDASAAADGGAPVANTSGDWEALAGVAYAAAGGGPAMNFRQGQAARRNVLQGAGALAAFTIVMVGILAISYGGFCYVDCKSNVRQIERAGEEIWRLYTEAFPDSPDAKGGRPPQDIGGVRTLALMRRDFEEHSKRSTEFNAAILGRPTLLDILKDVSERLSSDKVLLTDLQVRASKDRGQNVTIMGELIDPSAFEEQFAKLKQSRLLTMTGEPTIAQKQGKTTFTITAST